MTIRNSSLTKIYIGGVAIGLSQNVSLSVNGETSDVTNKDSAGWEANIAGKKNWEMSGDLVVDFAQAKAPDDLFTLLINGTYSTVKYMNNTSGEIYYEGSGVITTYNLSHPTVDKGTCSFTIKARGVLSQKTLT